MPTGSLLQVARLRLVQSGLPAFMTQHDEVFPSSSASASENRDRRITCSRPCDLAVGGKLKVRTIVSRFRSQTDETNMVGFPFPASEAHGHRGQRQRRGKICC